MEDAQELLLAMAIATRENAGRVLTHDGIEVLEMLEFATRNSEMSLADAWAEANATVNLSQRDNFALMAYVARMELIEQFDNVEQEVVG
jgi:hypothetical protein